MNNKLAFYSTISLLAGLLAACGADVPPIEEPDPGTSPALYFDLTVPDYMISGSAHTFSAQVPEDVELVEGRWQRPNKIGGYQNLSFQTEGVYLQEPYSHLKTYQTHNEVAQLRFFARDASGQTSSQSLTIPVYEQPLHVGQALTLQQGAEVNLTMVLDEAFQQEVSGAFDTLLWTQVEGPEVVLQDPATAVASFTAPEVSEVTRLRFTAQAHASATDIGFDREKVIYIVPEDEWVDVVAIHNSEKLRAVLRTDGSLLLYGVANAPSTRVLHLDIDAETVKDINGSITSVFALFEDGTGKTLFMRSVTDGEDSDPLDEVTNIQAIGGTRYVDIRGESYYLQDGGDLYGIERDKILYAQHIAGILSNRDANPRFNINGEIVDFHGDVLVEQVRTASGASNRIAYILQDGTIGHTYLIFPQDHFPNKADYADIEFSDYLCDQFFVTRLDGGVEALTANAHPLSPDVVDIKTLRASCDVNMALKQDGTALMWLGAYNRNVPEDFRDYMEGDEPAPWNLKIDHE